MKYLTLTILLMALLPAVYAADLFGEQLPPEVQKVVSELDSNLKEAFNEFNASIDKEVSKAERKKNTLLVDKLREVQAQVLAQHKIEAPVPAVDILIPTKNSVSPDEANSIIASYSGIDEKVWNKYGGVEVKVDSANGAKSPFKVKKGDVYLMVPNPEDRWCDGLSWKGDGAVHNYLGTDADRRALIWRVSSGASGSMLINLNSDEDCIAFMVNLGAAPATSLGFIRIKLFKVSE